MSRGAEKLFDELGVGRELAKNLDGLSADQIKNFLTKSTRCLLYTSPSPRD